MYSMQVAEKKDIEQLKKLEQLCFDETIRENFEYVLSHDAYLYMLVRNNLGDIVAYAGISISYEQGDVLSVCVDKEYRGQGLAKGLLKGLFEKAKEKGVEVLFLEVEEENLPAISLYKKLGFSQISKRENYYGNKTAIIMNKNL